MAECIFFLDGTNMKMVENRAMIKIVAMLAIIFVLVSNVLGLNENPNNFQVLKGPYLGQKPPKKKPIKFAPGIISTKRGQMNLLFSTNGKRLVYLFYDKTRKPRLNITYLFELTTDRWVRSRIGLLNKEYFDWEYGFAPDNSTLYFASSRPAIIENSQSQKINIWKIKLSKSGWTNPETLGFPVNTADSNDQSPAFTKDGTMYFFSDRDGGFGGNDLYRCRLINEKYSQVENLGKMVNTKYSEFDLFISPDETYLIFCSDRPGAHKGVDLYISFRRKNEKWSEPVNLGKRINSVGGGCPFVTGDGKYFFFTGDGNKVGSDIYWMEASFIEEIRLKINSN